MEDTKSVLEEWVSAAREFAGEQKTFVEFFEKTYAALAAQDELSERHPLGLAVSIGLSITGQEHRTSDQAGSTIEQIVLGNEELRQSLKTSLRILFDHARIQNLISEEEVSELTPPIASRIQQRQTQIQLGRT